MQRDYDPQVGRYVESDPIGLMGGSLSTYGYANGNPVTGVDPSGLLSFTPEVLQQALKVAGLAEIAGGGPEDPVADAVALVLAFGTIVAASDTATSPTASAASGSCPPRDPCKELRNRLKEHEQKLSDYLKNPLLNDNKGILGAATLLGQTERARSIYAGRVLTLNSQIANFKKLLAECEAKNGKR